jgi:hypothetical protein
MKPKKLKKLVLIKETIQNLDKVLDEREQDKVKGGTGGQSGDNGTTQVPIYC